MALATKETLLGDADDEYARQGAEAAALVANNPSLEELSTLDYRERVEGIRGYEFEAQVAPIDPSRPKTHREIQALTQEIPEDRLRRQMVERMQHVEDARTLRVLGGVAFRGPGNTITQRLFDGMPKKGMPRIIGRTSLNRFDFRY